MEEEMKLAQESIRMSHEEQEKKEAAARKRYANINLFN